MYFVKYVTIRIFSEPFFPVDSVLIRENTAQRKSVFWHILRSVFIMLLLFFKNVAVVTYKLLTLQQDYPKTRRSFPDVLCFTEIIYSSNLSHLFVS